MLDMTPDELERFERERVHHELRDAEGPASEPPPDDSASTREPITAPIIIRTGD